MGKNKISWKKELCQFSHITIIYQRGKNQKKLMCHFWEKCWTDRWMNRRKDRQTTVILQDPLYDGDPIIKVALIFPELISKHQIPVYSINFFVSYSQFYISATRVGTPIHDHAHSNIFQSTFNLNEFISTWRKSDFFIVLFYRYSWLKNPVIWLAKNILAHISGTKVFQDSPKFTAININFHYRPNWDKK